MIFGNKIKWFTHLNKNAPLLANEWGSFINVLDACLVNGYSEQQVTNISIVGNTLVLKYPQAHQYQQFQVVTITGANNDVLNGVHRITEVSVDGLSMSIEYESLVGIVETSLMLTTKITPLGWEKVYNGTNKAVYKFMKDTGKANYLFIDDSFPGAPYNTAWAKYAQQGGLKEYIMVPNDNYGTPASRGSLMVVLDENSLTYLNTPRLSDTEINDVILQRIGNQFTLSLNDVVSVEKTYTGEFNLNRYDNTIIGASKNTSGVVSCFLGTIYKIQALRNTTDLSFLDKK